MPTKRLKLENLKITSFLTSEESRNVRGREGSTGNPYLDCDVVCDDPITDPYLTMTCPASCNGTCYASCGATCETCESCEPRMCDTPGW